MTSTLDLAVDVPDLAVAVRDLAVAVPDVAVPDVAVPDVAVPDVAVEVIDLDADDRTDDWSALAEKDLAAGERIADPQRRRRFLAERREVRVRLGRLTAQHPAALTIRRGRNGKAELAGTPIHFSVSTRNATCAIATSGTHPVGVELAPVPARPPEPVLQHILPPRARTAVLAAEPAAQSREFAFWWCRVEAAVRACGAGLDEAATCLDAAPQDVRIVEPDLVAAVAAAGCATAPDAQWQLAERIDISSSERSKEEVR